MSETKKLYYKAVDGSAEGMAFGDAGGIHDIGIGEALGVEGTQGLPEDKNEPVDLLNETYDKICIESAREVRRKTDRKCYDAICAICDAMTLVCEKMEALKPFVYDEKLASLAGEMAALGDSLAKIRTSMESAPMFTGYVV